MKNKYEQSVLDDYLNAFKAPIQSLTILIKQQLRELKETFDYKQKNNMDIIDEQQTDRQCEEEQSLMAKTKKQFNNQIGNIIRIKSGFVEILNVYKMQVKDMAKSIIKLEQQLKNKKKQQLQQSRKKSTNKSNSGDLNKLENQQDLKVRKAPQPVKVGECIKCIKLEEDKTKWKTLSHKIQEFKKKNNIFEIQLKQKDSQIKQKIQQIDSLKQKITQLQKSQNNQKQQQERKKLKKENTNLRGEKVLLNNQLSSLRKQVAEKTEINQAQDIEIKKMRLQIDNLNSSLNWHISNLNELRNSQRRGQNLDQRQHTQRIQSLSRLNRILIKTITEQQQLLEAINGKTKRLQDSWPKQIQRFEKKIGELQSILQDKNQTIIKLKTGSKGQKQSSYQADMIKVLNKKLAEKQQIIRNLQQQIESFSL